MKFVIVIAALFMLNDSLAGDGLAGAMSAGGEVQKVRPKMRAVDRDWKYFKAIPCDEISQIVFHSRSEEILLAKRKALCLERFKAFLPSPVDR